MVQSITIWLKGSFPDWLYLLAVSPCDCMQIGVEAVVKVGVRLPDLLQHLHVEAQLVDHQVVRVLLQPLQEIIKEFVQNQ